MDFGSVGDHGQDHARASAPVSTTIASMLWARMAAATRSTGSRIGASVGADLPMGSSQRQEDGDDAHGETDRKAADEDLVGPGLVTGPIGRIGDRLLLRRAG